MTKVRAIDILESADPWYLAYGSNMSRAKFVGSRKIHPLDVALVFVPGWILTMEIPGLPYLEPAFSSVRPVNETTDLGLPNVIGVAYLITPEQYKRVIASEGGGIAYDDILVNARPVGDKGAIKIGHRPQVRTLGTARKRCPPARPSQRYMQIINTGASDAGLPTGYRQYLNAIPVYPRPEQFTQRPGAAIFTAIRGPVMSVMEMIVHGTTQKDGKAPLIVTELVRATMAVIWLAHDRLFAPVFGRGDGLDDQELDEIQSRSFLRREIMM